MCWIAPLFFLVAFVATGMPAAHADDSSVVWVGTQVSGYVMERGSGVVIEECHPTIRLEQVRGKEEPYFYPVECQTPGVNYLKLGWPLNGPPINMKGVRATHPGNARINSNGLIELR